MNKNEIKLCYLTWGESILDSGVFDNQVFNQLLTHKKIDSSLNILLLVGIPIITKRILCNPLSCYRKLMEVKKNCNKNGIQFKYRFLFVTNSWFYSKTWQLKFFHLFHFFFFRKLIVINNISIVHCRSYHAAHFCYKQKVKAKLNYKIIFDTRSQFPEEGVMLKSYSEDSTHYLNWKQIEQQLLDNCEAVITVSDTIKRNLNKISPQSTISQIYTSTDTDIFSKNLLLRKELRNKYLIEESAKVLIYIGDLNDYGWHRIDNLISLYKVFELSVEKSALIIVTNSYHTSIKDKLIQENIGGNVILTSSNSSKNTSALLNCGDYAALSYKDVTNEMERIIAYGILASKTGEYLSMGLPVLVNDSVGAASELVSEYGIGITYRVGMEEELISKIKTLDAKYQEVAFKAREIALANFSAKENSIKYLHIYKKLQLINE